MKWFKKDPTKTVVEGVFEIPVIPFKHPTYTYGDEYLDYKDRVAAETASPLLHDARASVEKALFEHAVSEAKLVDTMYLRMLQQANTTKYGLIVETSWAPTFEAANTNGDVMSLSVQTTATLSPEVPFGEIKYVNQ